MKKQSLIILFLSAILCLTMLFVSCDEGETTETTVETTTETTEEITTEAVIEDVEIDYSSIIADWTENIDFKAPEKTPVLDPYGNTLLATNTDQDNVQVYTSGSFMLVTTTEEVRSNFLGVIYETERTVKYEVYNVNTGEALRTFTVPAYNINNGYAVKSFEFRFFNGIFEVMEGTVTRTVVEETGTETEAGTETGAPAEPEYVFETTYKVSYYDHKGDVLATDFEESVYDIDVTQNGDELFYVGDKCYLIRDEEVFYTFNKGQERPLPNVDFEYLDYKYFFENNTVRVFDANFNMIAKYTVNAQSTEYPIPYVLSNGNVFVQYIYYLDEDAKDYDFVNIAGFKADIRHVLIDVTTGKATELELGYYVMSLNSNAYDNTNMTVKNDNQFAEVVKITDGKLATEVSFLILDNKMAEVKELPKILKNQTNGTRFLDNGKLLITMGVGSEEVLYTVDTVNKTVDLYVDLNDQNTVEFGEGFILNNVLYSANFVEIIDLSEFAGYEIHGDSIIYYDVTYDEFGVPTIVCKVLTVNGTSYTAYQIASFSGYSNSFVDYLDEIDCYVVYEIDYNDVLTRIAFYNNRGESIDSGLGDTRIIGSSDKGVTIMFRYINWDGNNDYYYFFKY